jgi:hypothetical protein
MGTRGRYRIIKVRYDPDVILSRIPPSWSFYLDKSASSLSVVCRLRNGYSSASDLDYPDWSQIARSKNLTNCFKYNSTIRWKPAANNKMLSMLASEHILIDVTLISSASLRSQWRVPTLESQMSFGIYHQLSIFDQQQYQAEVTQNISTAESPGRWLQPWSDSSNIGGSYN